MSESAKLDAELLAGPAWGFMLNGAFRALPKPPLTMAGFTKPPFDVTLPTGEVRHVIEEPTKEHDQSSRGGSKGRKTDDNR